MIEKQIDRKPVYLSQYGRVGLRRQFQVLVRKGVGSNPTVDNFAENCIFELWSGCVVCVVGFVVDAVCFGSVGDGNKILSLGSFFLSCML